MVVLPLEDQRRQESDRRGCREAARTLSGTEQGPRGQDWEEGHSRCFGGGVWPQRAQGEKATTWGSHTELNYSTSFHVHC